MNAEQHCAGLKNDHHLIGTVQDREAGWAGLKMCEEAENSCVALLRKAAKNAAKATPVFTDLEIAENFFGILLECSTFRLNHYS